MTEAGKVNSVSDTKESERIVPGLTGLSLNILHAQDMQMIALAKQIILRSLENNHEHPVVTYVQKTMVALLKIKNLREKPKARLELEEIVEESPSNLNALAELETLYRDLNRNIDADKCRRRIDNIMNSEAEEDIKIKRTCLLEQGYAILIERTIENENTLGLRISNLRKMLTAEQIRSEGKKGEYLERAIHHQTQVLRNLNQANEESTADDHLIKKCSSLYKFEMAEKLLAIPFPHPVWNFYHAKALNQYYDSLHYLSQYQSEKEAEMAEVTITAVRKFWDFAQLPKNPDITFIARSLAHIGQILVKPNRRDYFQSQEENRFDFIMHSKFQCYLNDPFEALEEALRLKSDEVSVLNRYGRSLWNISSVTDDKTQRIKYLKRAHDFLTTSINNDSQLNWFAYSTRMVVLLNLGNYLTGKNDEESKRYLKEAEKDGVICFESKHTRRDMTVLAEVCQKLSKFPKINRYGPEFVVSQNYLHKALDYLFYATHLADAVDYHWTNRISSCLFDLGEYEQAIEWQRKAWFISSPKIYHSFYVLCMYMLTRFYRDRSLEEGDIKKLFLKEFIYTLIYAKGKYIEKDIKTIFKKICRYQKEEIVKLLQNIIEKKVVSVNMEEKEVLIYYLEKMICPNRHDTLEILLDKLKTIVPEIKNEYRLSEKFMKTSLKPLSKGVMPLSKGSKFDFFVCHSHKDEAWVNNILLRHLEGTFSENDNAFRGCIADRDFQPGILVLDNIMEAIRKSNKVILVLTPDFVSSNWCHYESDQAIMQSLNLEREENRNFVIPLKLKDCEIPDKLAHLNYVNMTEQKDFMREMMRLKRAILPDHD